MSDFWLLLETSGRVGQLGLARSGSIIRAGSVSDGSGCPSLTLPARWFVRSHKLEETRRLARDLAPSVGEMLQAENLRPSDVAGVMVSIGPGSYTGLRVGIASAKAFAYAIGCPLIAVPTFAAIALQAPDEAKEVWVIADALQGMIYVQRFARGESLDELRIERAGEVLPQASAEIWFSGSGLAISAAYLPPNARFVPEVDREPTLQSLFRAGRSLAPLSRQELFALEPLYLRGSSAEEKAKMNEPRG